MYCLCIYEYKYISTLTIKRCTFLQDEFIKAERAFHGFPLVARKQPDHSERRLVSSVFRLGAVRNPREPAAPDVRGGVHPVD